MKISDCGIIVSKRLFEENGGIITVFTKEHGLCSGIVKNLYSGKGTSVYQIGNFVDFTWNARLSTHVGTVKCEVIRSYISQIIYNKTKLYALNSILDIVTSSLKPHEKYPDLFDHIHGYITGLVGGDFSFLSYIKAELYLLNQVGYSLDLSKCAVNQLAENLSYVSPKSGKAVSEEAGAPYASQMLPLPSFLTTDTEPLSAEEARAALSLTGYFFKRYVLHNQAEPLSRTMLYEMEFA